MPGIAADIRYLDCVHFGAGDPLEGCIWAAYREFQRTIHGLADHSARDEIRDHAFTLLQTRLATVGTGEEARSCAAFDRWHRSLTTDLIRSFTRSGFVGFTVGQAQKWINLSLKFAIVRRRVGLISDGDFVAVHRFAHAPVDHIFLSALKEECNKSGLDAPLFRAGRRWSRIASYDEYLRFQQWLRDTFPRPPLVIESKLWFRGISARDRGD
jgi:hypothetical protein